MFQGIYSFLIISKCNVGKHYDVQLAALEKMLALLKKIEWKDKDGSYKTTMKPFQKGLICTIKSTISLFEELKSEGVEYILTKRYFVFLRFD